MFIIFIIFPFSSPRTHLSLTPPHHQMSVLTTLKLLFLVSVLLLLTRSGVSRLFFSMAEGGCEKSPDHWNTEFFWTVIVEYISHGHPVDTPTKRWVTIRFLFFFFFLFIFKCYDLFFQYLDFFFSGFSYSMSPENWPQNPNCLPTQTPASHVAVLPVMDLPPRPAIPPVSLQEDGRSSNFCGECFNASLLNFQFLHVSLPFCFIYFLISKF